MKAFGWIVLLALLLIAVVFVGQCSRWTEEASNVAHEEFGAREMLRKYEWFKDAAAALDKKRADASLLEEQVAQARADGDTEGVRLYQSELFGVRASYNRLAAEYNAQMAKLNWAFAEAGRLPQGATEQLPREFKPYISGGAQ